MEQIVTKLIEQAPGVGALVIIVVLFLRHIRGEREEQNKFFTSIHEDNARARESSREAIRRNSDTIIENVRVTTKNTETIERLARAIEKCEIRTTG